MALVNQKQVEMDELRLIAQAAADNLEKDAHDNSKLQIDFSNLVHDYEQTQMKIGNMQKDVLVFKSTVEQLQVGKFYYDFLVRQHCTIVFFLSLTDRSHQF